MSLRLVFTDRGSYIRGETTSGAKRLVGAKRLGGKRPGGKRLGGETTRRGNGLGAKRPGFIQDTRYKKLYLCWLPGLSRS